MVEFPPGQGRPLEEAGTPSRVPPRWRQIGLAIALIAVSFAPALARTFEIWWDDPDYSHGFLMPLLALWFLHDRRDRIRDLSDGTSPWAVPILVVALFAMLIGQLDFMQRVATFAMVPALGAVLLAFLGWVGVRVFGPVLIVLLLACPLPIAVHQQVTVPLKAFSSKFAVGLLNVSGISTQLDGFMIHLDGADNLWVADACSGIRSLISLVSVAIVAVMFWDRRWWIKLLVVLAAVPIAVLANGFRIWLTGWLSVKVGPEAAEGAFHFFEGFALFAMAGLVLFGFAKVLDVLSRELGR